MMDLFSVVGFSLCLSLHKGSERPLNYDAMTSTNRSVSVKNVNINVLQNAIKQRLVERHVATRTHLRESRLAQSRDVNSLEAVAQEFGLDIGEPAVEELLLVIEQEILLEAQRAEAAEGLRCMQEPDWEEYFASLTLQQ